MHPSDERSILEYPNFTDWRNVDKSVDGGVASELRQPRSLPNESGDSEVGDCRDLRRDGDNLDRRPDNSVGTRQDCNKDEHGYDHANGFVEGSDARTTQLGNEDINDNKSNIYWKRGGRKWRLQMGLHVRGAVGERVDNHGTLKLLDGYCQMIELSTRQKDRVVDLVMSEDKRNVWNRWHGGDLGAAIGYGVLVLESDGVTDQVEKDPVELVEELIEGVDVEVADAVEYARQRADERELDL